MQRQSHGRTIRPQVEPLESRTLLATCHVTRLGDFGAGADIGGGHWRGDLRFCITRANVEPGPDIITFSRTGTIKLNDDLPDLASEIDIQGPGADLLTVSAEFRGRVFKVGPAGDVTISGLTMTKGTGGTGPIPGTLYGGGVYNGGTLTIRNSAIIGNPMDNLVHESNGGGIYNASNATLTVLDSTIANNTALGEFQDVNYGGGICNAGMASIYSSTIANNVTGDGSGPGLGGGLSNGCSFGATGVMVIVNSTVHGNDAREGGNFGDGIFTNGDLLVVSHSTIAGNVGSGIFVTNGKAAFMRNTLVADNGADIQGHLTSSGYNLIGDSGGGSGYAPTDLLDVDPMLGPLQDNGGPTETMALLPGSPAIDAGENSDAPEWDQRGPGFPRIVNAQIDIGAYEVQATAPHVRRGSPDPAVTAGVPYLVLLVTADWDDEQEHTVAQTFLSVPLDRP
jgi:hypothetical protein